MRPLSPTDATDGLSYVEAIEARLLLPTHGWRAADRTVARTEPTPGAGFQVGDERPHQLEFDRLTEASLATADRILDLQAAWAGGETS